MNLILTGVAISNNNIIFNGTQEVGSDAWKREGIIATYLGSINIIML